MPDALLTDWKRLHGDSFKNTRCLVTGGAGFIGSHISQALSLLGAQILVLDDLVGGDPANLNGFANVEFHKGSILDLKLVQSLVKDCQYVFHQAALGSVPGSVARPREYFDVNVTGTLNVLEASRDAKVQRVMFAASSSAYGDSEVLPKVETMPVLPKSPYAAHKVADEALMRAYAGSYGLDTACLRYFNIFGPRQNANSAYAAVIAAFAKAVVAGKHPVIFGDGLQSRDFTYVDNAVHANLLAARSPKPIGGEVLNVACGKRIDVNELAALVTKIFNRPDLTSKHESERTGDVKHSLADLTKIQSTLNYHPIVDFAPGLEVTLRWYESVLKK